MDRSDPTAPRRVALYSHDTQGLGHVRRNSLIAAALVAAVPDTEVLLLTGAAEARSLPLPQRTSVVTLPGLTKTPSGDYRASSLPLPLATVISVRSRILQRALEGFEPELLVVDKVPLGVHGELQPALARMRRRLGARTVLGLRDVLDRKKVAIGDWRGSGASEVVVENYDAVWVYADPRIYDPAVEYHFPARVRRKIAYTGYLGHGRRSLLAASRGTLLAPADVPRKPFVLGLVGGGEDGAALCRAFADAALPKGHRGVLITGPYLHPEERRRLIATAAGRDDLVVLDFVADVPAFIEQSTAAVAMAGYNTACELLTSGQPILLVPRRTPRREQAVRAKRLQRAGLADVVATENLTAAHLSAWLAEAVHRPRRSVSSSEVDLDGLARVPELAAQLLAGTPTRTETRDVAV